MKKESRDHCAAVVPPPPPSPPPPLRASGVTVSAFSAQHPRDPHEPHDRREGSRKRANTHLAKEYTNAIPVTFHIVNSAPGTKNRHSLTVGNSTKIRPDYLRVLLTISYQKLMIPNTDALSKVHTQQSKN